MNNTVPLQEKCIVSSSEDEFPKAMFAFHFQFPSGHKSGKKWRKAKDLESVLLKVLKSTLSDIRQNTENICTSCTYFFREIVSSRTIT